MGVHGSSHSGGFPGCTAWAAHVVPWAALKLHVRCTCRMRCTVGGMAAPLGQPLASHLYLPSTQAPGSLAGGAQQRLSQPSRPCPYKRKKLGHIRTWQPQINTRTGLISVRPGVTGRGGSEIPEVVQNCSGHALGPLGHKYTHAVTCSSTAHTCIVQSWTAVPSHQQNLDIPCPGKRAGKPSHPSDAPRHKPEAPRLHSAPAIPPPSGGATPPLCQGGGRLLLSYHSFKSSSRSPGRGLNSQPSPRSSPLPPPPPCPRRRSLPAAADSTMVMDSSGSGPKLLRSKKGTDSVGESSPTSAMPRRSSCRVSRSSSCWPSPLPCISRITATSWRVATSARSLTARANPTSTRRRWRLPRWAAPPSGRGHQGREGEGEAAAGAVSAPREHQQQQGASCGEVRDCSCLLVHGCWRSAVAGCHCRNRAAGWGGHSPAKVPEGVR